MQGYWRATFGHESGWHVLGTMIARQTESENEMRDDEKTAAAYIHISQSQKKSCTILMV